MTTKQDIVEALAQAWITKDASVFRKYMHVDMHMEGPMIAFESLDDFLDSIKGCPFESLCQNSDIIVQGDKVVHVFDWVVTAPFQATIPFVEVMVFEGDKVKTSRSFFDTAIFPADFIEQMKQQAA